MWNLVFCTNRLTKIIFKRLSKFTHKDKTQKQILSVKILKINKKLGLHANEACC